MAETTAQNIDFTIGTAAAAAADGLGAGEVDAARAAAADARTLPERVFASLDRARIPYCALHGFEDEHDVTSADIDCLIPPDVAPERIARALWDARAWLRAEPVQWLRGATQFIVLAGRDGDGSPSFLHLHVTGSYDLARRTYFTAGEVLAGRRRRGSFWVPVPAVEFACVLARRIEKGQLLEHHARALSALYEEDRDGCARQCARVWGGQHSPLLLSAAASGHWDPVRRVAPRLRAAQRRRASLRHPLRLACGVVAGTARVVRRWVAADRGLTIVFLGPDGAGKSSVARELRERLSLAFAHAARRTFPPALLNRVPAGETNATPHEVPQRSWCASFVRAVGYWLFYYAVIDRIASRRTLMRHALVIFDRHPIDALVDAKRYRYGGPCWLLRLIARLIPRPDLVILLDAPPHVVQARKQEVAPAEVARQIFAYRALVSAMPHGCVVDAARPLPEVSEDVQQVVLRLMADRVARRFGLDLDGAGPALGQVESRTADRDPTGWICEFTAALGDEEATVAIGPRGLSTIPELAAQRSFVALNGQELPDDLLRAAGFTHVRRFAVLPHARNPRWLIPLGSPAIAAAAFCMCNPFRTLARCKRDLARAMARVGVSMWYRDHICVARREMTPLEDVLAEQFGGQRLHLSFSLGSHHQARNSKVSLAVLDGHGRVLAFGKLPRSSPVARENLRHEGDLLAALAARTPGVVAPRLLFAGGIGTSYLTLITPLPGRPPGPSLTAAHRHYLSQLRCGPPKRAADTALFAALRERAAEFRHRPAVAATIARLEPILRDLVVPTTVFHGDFAPWNLHASDDSVAAFDWEYGELDGLPLLDETHYILKAGYLLRGWRPSHAHAALSAMVEEAPLGLAPAEVIALQMVSVLHNMLKVMHQGQTDDDPRLVWCREVLARSTAALDVLAAGDHETKKAAAPSPIPRKTPSRSDQRQVLDVLRQMDVADDESSLRITPLGSGGQASVWLARRADGRPLSAGGDDGLAIKIYNPGTHDVARVVREEYQSLQRLHDRLDRTILCGWNIRAPRPVLFAAAEPFALVMTVVPGQSLSEQLPDVPAVQDHPELDSIARAIVAALDLYWGGEPRLYGDLSVSNVLLDRASHTLSFIDASVPRDFYACEGVTEHWYPASRDVANMLYVAAAAIRTTLHSPGLRRRRLQMSERILAVFLERAETEADRLRLLREIHDCAQVHLGRIAVSNSLGGSWRRLVHWAAGRKVSCVLHSLRSSRPRQMIAPIARPSIGSRSASTAIVAAMLLADLVRMSD